ncbi:hypothetical protein [Burkholderia sp. SCN-KJ]|uniref:hypothetical protein n=1 Tax=Burkholderia sp. SCN-KJ TaxID=2969248 RepID=UPI0035AD9A49
MTGHRRACERTDANIVVAGGFVARERAYADVVEAVDDLSGLPADADVQRALHVVAGDTTDRHVVAGDP